MQGEFSDSFENIIKATSLNTIKPDIWYNLGVLYETCKQPNEALIAYEKAQEIQPGEPNSLNRIKIINSADYKDKEDLTKLQMVHPEFFLPNSLQINTNYDNSKNITPNIFRENNNAINNNRPEETYNGELMSEYQKIQTKLNEI